MKAALEQNKGGPFV